MYALHDLLNRDGRVLNRHAGKIYGFVPGLVTAVHDPKDKRHQRGYVKVYFPGLQDVPGSETPILPWARLGAPNAGGKIQNSIIKHEKKTVTVWDRVPKEVPWSFDAEIDEPVYEDKEEKHKKVTWTKEGGTPPTVKETKSKKHHKEPKTVEWNDTKETKEEIWEEVPDDKPPVVAWTKENFQASIDVHFKVDHPKPPGDAKWLPTPDLFLEEDATEAKLIQDCDHLANEVKAYLADASDDSTLVVYLDGHTSSTASFAHNDGLSQRRRDLVLKYLKEAFNKAGVAKYIGDVTGKGYGRHHTGEVRDRHSPSAFVLDNGFGRSHTPSATSCKGTQSSEGNQHECAACRRCDATFDASGCKLKVIAPGEHKTKKVFKGYKTTKENTPHKKTEYDEWDEEESDFQEDPGTPPTMVPHETTTTEKNRVLKGYDKTKSNISGTRTVYELKQVTKEIDVEVIVPGPVSGTGFYCPPQIGDEVVCAFEHGDIRYPYILGSVWNGKAKLPEPSTPADEKRDKKGPQTKAMKGDSLCGGGGKNKIGYFKSRTGNLVSLDDQNGVVRIQDKTGMSTVQLSDGKVEIMQSTADIYFYAKERIRFDCKDFIVEAKKNIWQHADNNYGVKAGNDNTLEATGTWALQAAGPKDTEPEAKGIKGIKFKSGLDMKIGADKMITIVAKGSHTEQGCGVQLRATGGNIGLSSKDKTFTIDAKGDAKLSTLMKHAAGAESDCNCKSDGGIDFSGLMKIKWKGEKVLLNAGGSPAGPFSLGAIVGSVIRGAAALVGKIAAGASAAVAAVAAKAQEVAGGAMDAIANSPFGKVVGQVADVMGKATNAIGGAVKEFGKAVNQLAGPIMGPLQGIVGGLGGGAGGGGLGGLLGNLPGPLADLAGAAQGALSQVGGALGGLQEAVGGIAGGLLGNIQDFAQGALDGVQGIADQLKDVADQALGAIDGAIGQAKGLIDGAVGKVMDLADGVVGGLKDQIGKLAGGLEDFAGGIPVVGGALKQGIAAGADLAGKGLDEAAGKMKDLAKEQADQLKGKLDDVDGQAHAAVNDAEEKGQGAIDEARADVGHKGKGDGAAAGLLGGAPAAKALGALLNGGGDPKGALGALGGGALGGLFGGGPAGDGQPAADRWGNPRPKAPQIKAPAAEEED